MKVVPKKEKVSNNNCKTGFLPPPIPPQTTRDKNFTERLIFGEASIHPKQVYISHLQIEHTIL